MHQANARIRLTRQQFDLMGKEGEEETKEDKPVIIAETKRSSRLKIIKANSEELAEHEKYLDALGEACIWRQAAAGENV